MQKTAQIVKKIYAIEQERLAKKGVANSIIAFILAAAILITVTQVGRACWPQKIDEETRFIALISFIIHTVCQILFFSLYAPGYFGWCKWYSKYRINKSSAWPWERVNWPQVRAKAIKNLVLNQLIIYPLIVYSSGLVGVKVRFINFPSVWELAFQLSLLYYMEDFFFYWAHRITHTYPTLYKFHKIHHQYDSLYTLITEYFHPVDYVLANIFPSAFAIMLLGSRAHCFTLFMWQVFKVFISTQGHSGYQFPWSPTRLWFLVTGPSYHDHHHSQNAGNYAGSCYLWDVICNTNTIYMTDFLKIDTMSQQDKQVQS